MKSCVGNRAHAEGYWEVNSVQSTWKTALVYILTSPFKDCSKFSTITAICSHFQNKVCLD